MDATQIARSFCRAPSGVVGWLTPLTPTEARIVAAVAEEHALGAMAYIVLRDCGQRDALDPATAERLAEQAAANGAAAERRRGELVELDERFSESGVQMVLLKEYAFDGSFPEPACVRQNDFDLMVRAEDLGRAVATLEEHGYARVQRPWPDEYRFKRPGSTTIDLQPASPEEGGAIFTRLGTLPGSEVRVLDPTDALQFLVIHTANHHNFVPFSKMVNCWNYLVAHRSQIDARRLATDLHRRGITTMAQLTLEYLCALVGHRLALLDELGPPARVRAALFRALFPHPSRYFQSGVHERLHRRARTGVHHFLYADRLRDVPRMRSSTPMGF